MWVCSSSALSGVSGSAIFRGRGGRILTHTHTVHSLHHYIDQSSVYVNDADTTVCVCVLWAKQNAANIASCLERVVIAASHNIYNNSLCEATVLCSIQQHQHVSVFTNHL